MRITRGVSECVSETKRQGKMGIAQRGCFKTLGEFRDCLSLLVGGQQQLVAATVLVGLAPPTGSEVAL